MNGVFFGLLRIVMGLKGVFDEKLYQNYYEILFNKKLKIATESFKPTNLPPLSLLHVKISFLSA